MKKLAYFHAAKGRWAKAWHLFREMCILADESGIRCQITDPARLIFRLGSVDVSSQEQASSGEMDEGEVSPGEFFEACEDPSIVFHIAEHDLDFMAFFIEGPVGFALD